MPDGTSQTSDLYAVIGVSRDASAADIRRAYRRLARDLHPDVRPDDPVAEERFKDVTYAYQILCNPERRRLYDEFGHLGLRDGFEPHAYRTWEQRARDAGYEGRLEDLFRGGRDGAFDVALDELFAGDVEQFLSRLSRDDRGHRARTDRPGRDVATELRIGFLDAVRGLERTVRLGGGGRAVRVRVPAGVRDGETLRLRGLAGDRHRPRDLVLTVRVEPHPLFRRDGEDLHIDLPVTPSEAFRGGRVSLPTLHGEVSVAIPERTQSGARLRLRGKGVARSGGPTGDLFIHVRVVLPTVDNDEVRRALDTISAACGDVRASLGFT